MVVGVLWVLKKCHFLCPFCSVADPDPHVFGPPGSGFTSQMDPDPERSGSFYHDVKIVRKTLIPSIL